MFYLFTIGWYRKK